MLRVSSKSKKEGGEEGGGGDGGDGDGSTVGKECLDKDGQKGLCTVLGLCKIENSSEPGELNANCVLG
ncbi:hypothetical protein PpBr36_04585 [Pyricularia pennisetigena]|uniref:hypothetical protein n=1 Tax=Pyricularia pennisetigena TaxID=1578925 RepID=UPI00114D94B2|nr:hypothetical protein PpBr36_04585 [Pyricularia pennisetigena]TLS26397.1 hypothetical protein PpBr36_04585 [Pyricularia pennisetigena]